MTRQPTVGEPARQAGRTSAEGRVVVVVRTDRRTLAEKINHLFAVVRPGDTDREYSGREVVASVRAAGTDLSPSHLSELRRGVKVNPTMRVLEGLARFFDVRVAYFLDDPQAEEEVEGELELRCAMRDAEVRAVAARVAGLDPAQRGAMNRLLVDLLRDHSSNRADSSD